MASGQGASIWGAKGFPIDDVGSSRRAAEFSEDSVLKRGKTNGDKDLSNREKSAAS